MRCCVSLCKNDSRHISKSQGITFHVIPTEPTLRSAWLKALGKDKWSPRERSAVCSEHFAREDLYETKHGLRKVRPGAVPVVGEGVTSCVFGVNNKKEVETLKVCRICLDTDCKLLEMGQYKLEQAYEQLTGIMVREDSLPQRLCPECAQRLLNCDSFRRKSLRANALMLEVVDKQNLLTTENIKTINRNNNQLTSSLRLSDFNLDKYDLEVKHVEKIEEEIKQEENMEVFLPSEVKVKDEVETTIDNDGGALEDVYSSDDNRVETTEVDPLEVQRKKNKKANINNETKAIIIALHKSGHNKKQISEETGLNVEERPISPVIHTDNSNVGDIMLPEITEEERWNFPGTSSQPTAVPPENTPVPPPTTATIDPDEHWTPPAPKKKKKNGDIAKLFVECDRTAREYARERDLAYERLETERLRLREYEIRERVRQRDLELSLQAQWLEFLKEAMNVIKYFGCERERK